MTVRKTYRKVLCMAYDIGTRNGVGRIRERRINFFPQPSIMNWINPGILNDISES